MSNPFRVGAARRNLKLPAGPHRRRRPPEQQLGSTRHRRDCSAGFSRMQNSFTHAGGDTDRRRPFRKCRLWPPRRPPPRHPPAGSAARRRGGGLSCAAIDEGSLVGSRLRRSTRTAPGARSADSHPAGMAAARRGSAARRRRRRRRRSLRPPPPPGRPRIGLRGRWLPAAGGMARQRHARLQGVPRWPRPASPAAVPPPAPPVRSAGQHGLPEPCLACAATCLGCNGNVPR